MAQKRKLHKFGGTSVLNAERYRQVYDIITKRTSAGPKAIVVSAMKGVTDDLIRVVDLAKTQNEEYKSLLAQIEERHQREITALLEGSARTELIEVIKKDFHQLAEILRGVWLTQEATESIYARVSGMGEVWSAQILHKYFLQQKAAAHWLDARSVLVVKHHQQRVVVDWPKSQEKLNSWLTANDRDYIVITGFVASHENGMATTLGRNGSDYSASIFGVLLACDEIFIWTDVDGVMSADPQQIKDAIILNEMSYDEVTELAYFGAKVVHPSTMAPAVEKQIPIYIKNTFNPDFAGTKIHSRAKSDRAVKGFSTIGKMALLNLEGSGLIGVIGVAERMFHALRSAEANVVVISQASSEQSICVAVAEDHSQKAKDALERTFSVEIQKGLIKPIQITRDVSILAAVGDNMAHTPGIAGRFFTALGQAGVNVRAIAQGATERNISAVIDSSEALRALRTVHSSFISPHQRMSIGLIGPGLIGSQFLQQLRDNASELRKQKNIELQIRAIANSQKMLLSEDEIPLANWTELFETKSQPLDLKKFAEHVQPAHIPHAVIIESTASADLVPRYKEWLRQGIHVISPNKKANTGTMSEYQEIRTAAGAAHRHFLYSTNVGAGLPIIQTLRDLCATGDRVVMIQGILSGTLSFIFNQYDGRKKFSEIVMEAKNKGYTEPDPREDLSGQDVVRKLVILAREAGMQIETTDVAVESLVPEKLRHVSPSDFMNKISDLDGGIHEKFKTADGKKQILRFVATLKSNGEARVGLEALPVTHAFARASGTDNMVLFQTDRYRTQPLVVQGPGAGPEVTAAGVFADLLRLSKYLGSTL